ncbi:MAG: hypothetical protein HOE69_06430 [Euryarchaeota archaeon]|jgi:hypothetical protein|nr:hypothetical protein [Euryarchaeota archaeon]
MAGGGESVEVAPHDIAIIVGAIGIIGAFAIAMFATLYIPPTDFGEVSSTQQVRIMSVGILGSNDDVVIHATPMCGGNESCSMNSIKIIDEDGNELSSTTTFEIEEDGSFTSSNSVDVSGKVTVEMNGQGSWEISVTNQRQIPVQFIPAIVSIFVLVWGIWRKMQDVDGDADISDVVESS